jgi:peptidoglycan/xylan/chitin deacetylase (PgdA/CDA1 family)
MTVSVVISLDFELRWGLLDVLGTDMSRYRKNLEGVRDAVPRLLETFTKRGVGATWAVVGSLACDGWDEWSERAPPFPKYADPALLWNDAYRKLDPRGTLYFARDLVDLVAKTPHQELGSHTFSHVYTREPGFLRSDAEADADAMVKLFQDRFGTRPRSLVFPRNQVAFEDVLRERGITAFRTNPKPFYWNATTSKEQTRTVRALRLADSLAPLGRRGARATESRASYFVRLGLPRALWSLHFRRIVADAAHLRDGESLHLWWHPHNLGKEPVATVRRVGDLLDALADCVPRGTRFVSQGDAAG